MIRDPFTLLRPFVSSLTIGLFTKADDIRSDAAAAEALGARTAAGVRQMHGRDVIVVRDELKRTTGADGMATDVNELALCIRWADCQNFVVYFPERNVAGVLHVGWRCLVAGTIPSFFETVKKEWRADGDAAIVGAGPSLCLKCSDFTDPARELPTAPARFVDGRCIDLRGWAEAQFADCGVRPDRFERLSGCTRCEPETYWTYRGRHREEVKAGKTNMLTIVLR